MLCQNDALAMSAAANEAVDMDKPRKVPRYAVASGQVQHTGHCVAYSCPALDVIDISNCYHHSGR